MHKTKEQRQQEAIERDLARDARTTDEQLRLIRQRPGKSANETARLTAKCACGRNYSGCSHPDC